MADVQPFDSNDETLNIDKRHVATLALAISVAALTLSRATKLDTKYWVSQTMSEAKRRCSKLSTEEVAELIQQIEQLGGEK